MKYLAWMMLWGFLSVNSVQAEALRPPAVPLVACDPYFSIWSPANQLTDVNTTHWTGKPNRLFGVVTIDGTAHRILGAEPSNAPALPQRHVTVLPTRTIYEFASPTVEVTLTFLTPSLPDSIDQLSWPVTYVSLTAKSLDNARHHVTFGFEAAAEIAVNEASQAVVWSKPEIAGLSVQAVGAKDQAVLARSGDDLRIEWGYLYLAATQDQQPQWHDHRIEFDLGNVSNAPTSRWLMLAYDDLYSIQYMGQNLRPYWRRTGWQAADLLKAAAAAYGDLSRRCEAFDRELLADVRAAGGDHYADLCALAYRQCFAAGKFVADANGQPLQFCKENHSNGCIATSDVFYPMAPQFLLFGPSLTKSFLVPFMQYAASDRWRFPFAPHDLGQYPLANGQVYGGGERTEENQMPVEETGNLLLLITATAQMEGKPDFANLYWKQIQQWASYLMEKGFDPENQLCTDDFAGHLAHNVNLSAKAICAIGAYAKLCEMRGDQQEAQRAREKAQAFATRWVEEAREGDHYRLAFDKPGSWSQKYNLIWDRILGLNLFPAHVAEQELAYYRKIQNEFGLPLDNRETYTKLDWITWTATLTQKRDDFEALIDPIITFINHTPDRSPLTDWYQTKTAKKVGFTARPVIGGVFAQMLYQQHVWQKWASRDKTAAGNWAPIPARPIITSVVPAATEQPQTWHYTTQAPADSWKDATFDAKDWPTGKSGFGTPGTPSAVVSTPWKSADIWMVRDVEIPSADLNELKWFIHHDEDAQVYVNGHEVEQFAGYSTAYEVRALSAETRQCLKPGKNRIAVHCHQTNGGQYIDVGVVRVQQPASQ